MARTVFWLSVVGAVVVGAAAFHRPLFLALVREDGPIEWLQFAVFLVTSLLLAVAFWRLTGIAGEEISWGQRLLGLETRSRLRRSTTRTRSTSTTSSPSRYSASATTCSS